MTDPVELQRLKWPGRSNRIAAALILECLAGGPTSESLTTRELCQVTQYPRHTVQLALKPMILEGWVYSQHVTANQWSYRLTEQGRSVALSMFPDPRPLFPFSSTETDQRREQRRKRERRAAEHAKREEQERRAAQEKRREERAAAERAQQTKRDLRAIRRAQEQNRRAAERAKKAEVTRTAWDNAAREAGFAPLETFPGVSKRWRVRHRACGDIIEHRTARSLATFHCPTCTAEWWEAEMYAGGYIPLEHPPTRTTAPWPAQCVACGAVVTPTLASVREGHGCRRCGQLKAISAALRARRAPA